jgi:hypothetical protein
MDTFGPAEILGNNGYEFSSPGVAPPAAGCAMVAGSGSGTQYSLGWTLRPVLMEPAVGPLNSSQYFAADKTWKNIPATDSSAIVGALGYIPANDANVLHRTGSETKNGTLSVFGSGNSDFDGLVVGPQNQSQQVKIGYVGIESSYSLTYKANIGGGDSHVFKNNGNASLLTIGQTGRVGLGGQVKLYGVSAGTLGVYQNDEATLGNLLAGSFSSDVAGDYPITLRRGGTVAAYLGHDGNRDFAIFNNVGSPVAKFGTTTAGNAATFSGGITATGLMLGSGQRVRWGGQFDDVSPSIEGSYSTGAVTVRVNGGSLNLNNLGVATFSQLGSRSIVVDPNWNGFQARIYATTGQLEVASQNSNMLVSGENVYARSGTTGFIWLNDLVTVSKTGQLTVPQIYLQNADSIIGSANTGRLQVGSNVGLDLYSTYDTVKVKASSLAVMNAAGTAPAPISSGPINGLSISRINSERVAIGSESNPTALTLIQDNASFAGDVLVNHASQALVKMRVNGIDKHGVYTTGSELRVYDYVNGGDALTLTKNAAVFSGTVSSTVPGYGIAFSTSSGSYIRADGYTMISELNCTGAAVASGVSAQNLVMKTPATGQGLYGFVLGGDLYFDLHKSINFRNGTGGQTNLSIDGPTGAASFFGPITAGGNLTAPGMDIQGQVNVRQLTILGPTVGTGNWWQLNNSNAPSGTLSVRNANTDVVPMTWNADGSTTVAGDLVFATAPSRSIKEGANSRFAFGSAYNNYTNQYHRFNDHTGNPFVHLDHVTGSYFADPIHQTFGAVPVMEASFRSRMTGTGQHQFEVGDGAGAWQTGFRQEYNAVGGYRCALYGQTPVAQSSGWAVSNYTVKKTFDPTVDNLAGLYNFVCTMAQRLKDLGAVA